MSQPSPQTTGTTAPLPGAPLARLDHVAIAVDDIAAAVTWYGERFPCTVLYQDPTWALLGFENVRLALVVPEQHPPHVAFLSDDAASFGPLVPHRDGTRSTYIVDPSGNSVEILADD